MPRRRDKRIRPSLSRDIEAVRSALRSGVLGLSPEEQKAAGRSLSPEQRALFAALVPSYRGALGAKFLAHCQPDSEALAIARAALKDDIKAKG